MTASFLNRIKWFVVLVLVQGVIIGQIQASRFAVPLLYTAFLLKLPSDIGRKQLLLYAFFIGLSVDVFGNTPGLNATASIWLAMIRPVLLRWQTSRDASECFVPGIKSMGLGAYFRYIAPAILFHSLILNVIDAFLLAKIEQILLATVADGVVTILLLLIIELVGRKN